MTERIGYPSRNEQRDVSLRYLEELFAKQLEVTMGEPYEVKITPSADFINPERIIVGFEKASLMTTESRRKHQRRQKEKEDMLKRHYGHLTFLFQETSRYFGLHEDYLLIAQRGIGEGDKTLLGRMFIVLYVVRKMRSITLTTVAKFMGYEKGNHTAVLYYKRKAEEHFEDDEWKSSYIEFEKHITEKIRDARSKSE